MKKGGGFFMKKDFLSREEDIRFSKTVIDFNSLGDKADDNLKNEIKDITTGIYHRE